MALAEELTGQPEEDRMQLEQHLGGVMIGMLMGFDEGVPQVVFPGNPEPQAISARSLTQLGPKDVGVQLALLFEDGRRSRPLIIGRILPSEQILPSVAIDGDLMRIEAKERIELRVGEAAIILEKNGHVTIRGTHVVSQADGSNRIRGGSVDLN